MTEQQILMLRTYLYDRCMSIAEYYPEYNPNSALGLGNLLELYFNWAYYKNAGYFPEMSGGDFICIYLQSEWARWIA